LGRGFDAVAGDGANQPEIKANGDRSGAELRRKKPGIEIVTEPESGGLPRESATSSRNNLSQQRESRQLDPMAKQPKPKQQKANSQEVHA
jgi:hypothetical protein